MSLAEAQRAVYFGFIGAFLTPSRLGDYPARVTMMHHRDRWLEAIALGFVGTLALAFLQVFLGMPSCIMLLERVGDLRWVEWLCVFTLLLQVLIIIFYPVLSEKIAVHVSKRRLQNTLLVLAGFSHRRFLTTVSLSFLRYAVYCTQLWLVMVFCGINLSFAEVLIAIPAYYLLVTVTPSVPLADAAVRGSWSVVIFGVFCPDIAAIAVAAVLLWLLNTVLPMLVAAFMPKFHHP